MIGINIIDRWLAPEFFRPGSNRNTVKTDVWSMGVLIWECENKASQPYFPLNLSEVARYVSKGGRLVIASTIHPQLSKKKSKTKSS